MTAEFLTLPPDTLGYAYNRGGLNNQKLALFGLFLRAFREGPRRLVLPDFILFDQISFNHIPVPISHAFQLDELRAFAARHEIEIVDIPARGDQGGWDHFRYGSRYIPFAALSEELSPESFPCDFFRSLIPTIKDSDLLRKVSDEAFGARDIRVVAQLRIERDWVYHTDHRLRPVVSNSEDNRPCFKDIIRKLRNTIGADEKRIYVVCDEAALPVSKSDIREAIMREFDIDLFWKSDFLTQEEIGSLSLLTLSCLDFEMAIRANSFVGLTRSTFSNMVGVEKYARTGAPLEHHYIYNVQGPRLALRADNGAFSVPALAMASDAKTSTHYFDLGEIFRAAGEPHKALASYSLCSAADGPGREEVFLSLYRAAQIEAELGFPAAEVIDTYSRATGALPNRAEALHGAARFCRNTGLYERGYEFAAHGLAIAYPKQAMGVEDWIYEYGLLDEFAVNAYWMGKYAECADACDRLLSEGKLPTEERGRVLKNKESAVRKQQEIAALSSPEAGFFLKLLREARQKEELALPNDEVIAAYMEATSACPTRAEALHGAARFCRNRKIYERGYEFAAHGLAVAYPKDAMGVESWIYEYGLLDELAVNAYWIGKCAECVDACDRLLSEGKLPTEERERVLKNKQFAIDKFAYASATKTVT